MEKAKVVLTAAIGVLAGFYAWRSFVRPLAARAGVVGTKSAL